MQQLHRFDGRASVAVNDDELVALYRWPATPDRAYVRSNFVATLDGSVQGLDGRSGSINTESDHHVFALHRALCDVILVGAGTVRGEGYAAVDLQPWQRSLRTAEGLTEFPTLAVITGSLGLDPAFVTPDVDHGPVIIMTTGDHSEAELRPFTDAGAEVLQAPGSPPGSPIELAWLLAELTRRGLCRVLCEGGPTVHRDLLAAGLLDELSLTLAPHAVGGAGHRSTSGNALPVRADFDLRFVLVGDDQTLFTSYRRRS